MRVRVPSLRQDIHFNNFIMKDSFKKIQSLANELAKNADVANGGGIIILAADPQTEEGKTNSVVFMKGMRIELLATLCASFGTNDTLKELVRDALFMSAIMPNSVIQKSEKPQ